MNNKKIRKETLNEISRIVNELVGEGGDGGATVKVLDTIEAAIHTVWNSLDGEAGYAPTFAAHSYSPLYARARSLRR